MGHNSMGFCTQQQLISGWLVTLTMIGQEVSMIERAHQGESSLLGQQRFLGTIGSKDQLHLV